MTVVAREGAAAAVADEDLVSDDDGHGPPLASSLRGGASRPGARRLGAKAPPFLSFDEQLEGALQQDGVVPTRVGVSEERAGAGESALEGGVDLHAECVSRRGSRGRQERPTPTRVGGLWRRLGDWGGAVTTGLRVRRLNDAEVEL